jgi:hypothetical protein
MKELFYLGTLLGSSLDTRGSNETGQSVKICTKQQHRELADSPGRGGGWSAESKAVSAETEQVADRPRFAGGLSPLLEKLNTAKTRPTCAA